MAAPREFNPWTTPSAAVQTPLEQAHPDSPAGGCGPGYSQRWGPETGYFAPVVTSHPRAPEARQSDWAGEIARDHMTQRGYAVYLATRGALSRVGGAIVDATGAELHEMLAGLLPGLLMAIVIPAITTAVGTAAGAVVGFFAGGVGAVPGAAAGATLGLEAGIFILEWLGIGFLVAYIGKSLVTGIAMGSKATLRAWSAVNHQGELRHAEITAAAIDLASAVAEVFRGILQGVVAFLLAKGTAAAAARVPEVVAKLKSSRLGTSFATWVERNWQSLITNPKLSDAPTNVRATGARPAAPAVTPSQLVTQGQSVGKSTDGLNASVGKSIATPPAATKSTAKPKFGNTPQNIQTSSGIPIQATPGKTTTILGNYARDMNGIINDQLKYPKTTDFGPKPGEFNVLNVPDEMYKTPEQFWNDINKPFLDAAIQRGDEIPLATKPTADVLYRDDGSLTGFGREIQHLVDNGYHYDATTGKMLLK